MLNPAPGLQFCPVQLRQACRSSGSWHGAHLRQLLRLLRLLKLPQLRQSRQRLLVQRRCRHACLRTVLLGTCCHYSLGVTVRIRCWMQSFLLSGQPLPLVAAGSCMFQQARLPPFALVVWMLQASS